MEIVKLIMKHRKNSVDVHATTNWGDNAAHHAALKGNIHCLKYLIEELNISVKKGEIEEHQLRASAVELSKVL